MKVFERDGFVCQNNNCSFCQNKKGVLLNAHHIKGFSEFPGLRFELNNGRTYCQDYHLGEIHGLRQFVTT